MLELGNFYADIILLKAFASSSTNFNKSSLILLTSSAISLNLVTSFSHPLVLHDKFATIPARDNPKAPTQEETDPPPGAGDSLKTSSEKVLSDNSDNFCFFLIS